MSGVASSWQTGFAEALLDPSLCCPTGLRAWNGSDPTVRLAVHRNNVIGTLVDALADTFPVVQELVGVAFFRAMAAVHVRQSPPRSRVLAHYGRDFPGFIVGFGPAASVPYLADMARLEMARVEAYHSADAAPLAAAALGDALGGGERTAQLLLACHPALRLLRLPHAVVSLWAAHQDGSDLAAIDTSQPEDALVLRTGLQVLVLRLGPGGAAFVAALQEGLCLGDACAAALGETADFDLGSVLALLLQHGALTSIHLPSGDFS